MLDTGMRESMPPAAASGTIKHVHGFESALELHDAMVKAQLLLSDGSSWGEPTLRAFEPLLNERLVPWPQLRSLKDHLHGIDADYELSSAQREEHLALTNDLAIWIVETYYSPESLRQVGELKPVFQRAGLGYLLYRCFERHRHRLAKDQQHHFQLLFEEWINSIWDNCIELPLPENIHTVGQFIAWLTKGDRLPRCIAPIIEELKESER